MKIQNLLLPLYLCASIVGFSTQAAQEGHGGNIVDCSGKEAVVLDYYHATLPNLGGQFPKLVDLHNLSTEEFIGLFNKRTENRGYFKSAPSTAGSRPI